MKTTITLLTFILCLIVGCKKEGEDPILNDFRNFDVVLIAGQSNTDSGLGLDLSIDTTAKEVYQLGRFDTCNWKIIKAIEPLHHHDRNGSKIGFALTFANQYVKSKLLENGRNLLLVPCGFGGTGFKDKRWNKGNDLYNDAIKRVNFILKGNVNNKLVAILWHQGENDVYLMTDDQYKKSLDNMIFNMRKDIVRASDSVPFILGGMVPFWAEQDIKRFNRQKVIESTPDRIRFCGYANPERPFLLQKVNDWEDMIHYDAIQQRELGKRYFSEYLKVDSLLKK